MSEKKNKPVLDEQTFEKLLEAAYVIQEHTRKRGELGKDPKSPRDRPSEPQLAQHSVEQKTTSADEAGSRSAPEYAATLAAIVETQHQIQVRQLDLDKAMTLVAERVCRITGASGAAIAMLVETMVRYCASSGSRALPVGAEVAMASAICHVTLFTGQVTRADDVKGEVQFDSGPCLQRGILSLVAVPIYHDGEVVGALELYFDRVHGFSDQAIHTTQLMAGLVTEAISRDAQSNLRKSVATERSTMMAAIERLKPDLAGMADVLPAAAANSEGDPVSEPAGSFPCWKCGNSLLVEEQFCGRCGAARAKEDAQPSMQRKFAAAWHSLQMNPTIQADLVETSSAEEAKNQIPAKPFDDDGHIEFPPVDDPIFPAVPFSPQEVGEEISPAAVFAAIPQDEEEETERERENEALSVSHEPVPEHEAQVSSTALVPQPPQEIWTSAARARAFLESVLVTQKGGAFIRMWRTHRGYFYLGVAIIMIAVVARGVWSENGSVSGRSAPATSAGRHKQPAPDANLSVTDKLLVSLGLADPPDPPEYKGNPDTQVWVDLHTALYYCPGSDLYGKTAKGRMSSQRDAQLDQFEPADRKACD